MWIDVAMALSLITAGWMSMRYAYMQVWGTWLSLLLVRLVYTLYSKRRSHCTPGPVNDVTSVHRPADDAMQYIYALSSHLVLMMFVLIWVNDTGAFACRLGHRTPSPLRAHISQEIVGTDFGEEWHSASSQASQQNQSGHPTSC